MSTDARSANGRQCVYIPDAPAELVYPMQIGRQPKAAPDSLISTPPNGEVRLNSPHVIASIEAPSAHSSNSAVQRDHS
ncbi:hypothetical protein [Rhodococcus erythropolis]|uniref:hypothetical protein n=1 Tax=Rhodococcus erythropolis TaxID=1833 RepID=UPI0030136864